MTLQLQDKIALVTGAASGIGFATVERFVAEGATVIAADVSVGGLARLADATGVETVVLDVSNIDQWRAVVDGIMTKHGRIDIAYLNAGIMTRPASDNLFGDVSEVLTVEGYRRITSVNADGAALGVIALLPHLAAGSDIVITASVAGLVPFPNDPWYGMTKHAMVGLARSLGPALEPRGHPRQCRVPRGDRHGYPRPRSASRPSG